MGERSAGFGLIHELSALESQLRRELREIIFRVDVVWKVLDHHDEPIDRDMLAKLLDEALVKLKHLGD